MLPNVIHRESSIRDKLKYSICCFSGTIHNDALEHGELCYNKLHIPRTPTTPSSPSSSSWFKKSTTTTNPSEFCGDATPRVRGRSLRSRMGRRHHQRATQSADFSYDPSSYALNFENESPEEFPFRNFSSRLPASPPPNPKSSKKFNEELAVTNASKEMIVGLS
ncbi:hypothetical protein RIF29_27217 [Crotalaria pallida]|uniref:Uncharacterized protein n=1 Tax=Crotalaria pallida TaxID=3830 RepID=A0AAN9I093_CROPI